MTAPVLKVIGLSKHYGGKPVLENLSLDVSSGEIVGIQGPSGMGKTTLLKCIAGIEPFQSGTVLVDQKDIRESSKGNVGIVFQDYHLWPHMTVLENIIEAPIQVHKKTKEGAIAEARVALTKMNMGEHEHKYPHQLSGGQQQRVALARSLATNPKVLLLDEVTAALDPKLVQEIGKTLRNLANEGKAIVIVSHQPKFLKKIADRIISI